MRITLGMITSGIRDSINKNANALLESQNQSSSGKRIQKPSDDVPGTGRALALKSAISAFDQYDRNSTTASGLLSASSDALTGIITNLQTVRTLASQGASKALTPEGQTLIASQLDQIEGEFESAANTQYLGRYLFSGNLTDTPPVAKAQAGGHVYQGDAGVFSIQVAPGINIATNTTADAVFNIGGVARPGEPDVFTMIETLRDNVKAGNVTAISAQLDDIDKQLLNVTGIRSQLGGRMDRLQSTSTALRNSELQLKDRLSATEDVDIAEAVVDLQTRQNVYQAALGVAGKILGQQTLVDYMR